MVASNYPNSLFPNLNLAKKQAKLIIKAKN